jgi:hypothetical protein
MIVMACKPDFSTHTNNKCGGRQRRAHALISSLLPPLPVQVIVMARKPDFYNFNMSLYEVFTEDGLLH